MIVNKSEEEQITVQIGNLSDWLSVTPVSDTLQATQMRYIELTNDASDLDAGDYNSEIKIKDNASIEKNIPVKLTVKVAALLNEHSQNFNYKIAPNPFTNHVKFVLDTPQQSTVIEIFNMHGKLIFRKDISNQSNFVWSPNATCRETIYFYKIITNKTCKSGKIVKLQN